jgi:GNAT superfamily N-acetyltransferase
VWEYGFENFGALVEMYKHFEPKRVAQGLPPPDVPRIASWLDKLHRKSWALVALDGQKVVGHTILCPMSGTCVEFSVFVHQDYREDGLGTALSQLTLDWARQAGMSQAYLTTELSNFPALCLFRRLGFLTTSSFGDECEMKLELASAADAEPKAA